MKKSGKVCLYPISVMGEISMNKYLFYYSELIKYTTNVWKKSVFRSEILIIRLYLVIIQPGSDLLYIEIKKEDIEDL